MKSMNFILCAIVALMSMSEYAHDENPLYLLWTFAGCLGMVLNHFYYQQPDTDTHKKSG